MIKCDNPMISWYQILIKEYKTNVSIIQNKDEIFVEKILVTKKLTTGLGNKHRLFLKRTTVLKIFF